MSLSEKEIDDLLYSTFLAKKDILKLIFECGTQKGHLGGCFSCVELLIVLYLKIMNISNSEVVDDWNKRDRFILSKGHAGIAMYAVLKQAGLLNDTDLNKGIRGDDTILFRHPKYNPKKGIECSVGSLGMGIGFAVGLAEVSRLKSVSNRIFVMLGDGECNEGSVWESVAYAAHRKLDNLVIIIDKNNLQLDGYTYNILNMDNLADKFTSFGCEVSEINGHDFNEIYCALRHRSCNKPLVIIANTKKGNGISFAEDCVDWHDNYLSEKLFCVASKDLDNYYQKRLKPQYKAKIGYFTVKNDVAKTKKIKDYCFDFSDNAIEQYALLGCKDIIGFVFNHIAEYNKKFILVYSDCAKRIGIEELQKNHGEKCYETGIAEQTQIMISAAFALEGYDTFAVAYAPFITARVLDQIRCNLSYMKSPVKLIGLSSGYAASDLGATHTALEDISNMRNLPNMVVICPADCTEIAKTLLATSQLNAPCYIRITSPINIYDRIYNKDYKFKIGQSIVLKDGSDIAIISCGAILSEVLKAANELEEHMISTKVINMHTIKPLDEDALFALKNYKLVITVEEHSVIGGLGSAVAEFYSSFNNHPPLKKIGVKDQFLVADLPINELKKNGLVKERIVETILSDMEND